MISLGVVCEDHPDFQTATTLTTRTVAEFLSQSVEATAQQIKYHGHESSRDFLKWSGMPKENFGMALQGLFDGKPGAPDAYTGRRALYLFRKLKDQPQAVLLIRDVDREPKRRIGLNQARLDHEKRGGRFGVIIALANPKREAWILSGFKAENEAEIELHKEETKRLKFDPTKEPERLSARPHDSPHNIKPVVAKLTQNDKAREHRCVSQTKLSDLRENGKDTGLPEFLDEIKERLLPIFAAPH